MMAAMLICGTTTVFSACSSDDDGINTDGITMSDIAGRWKLTDAKISPDNIYAEFELGGVCNFIEDGTFISSDGKKYVWTVSSNTIIISDGGYYNTYTILKLTKTTMELKEVEDDYTITMTFERV
jgi:hypothetical protein